MAIVDGKRILGLQFYVTRTAQLSPDEGVQYVAVLGGEMYRLCCFLARGESPLEAKFRYCSAQLQPASIDRIGQWHSSSYKFYRPVSWRQVPEDWKTIFRRDFLD